MKSLKMSKGSLSARQSGFTLVEIAIVLVIIGLLLGGVLKGQELIEQSKIKRVINDFNSISAAYNTYKDRYHFMPGDDPNTATRWATEIAGGPAIVGNGNSIITGTLAQTLVGGANESGYAWQHLRLSGLVSGDISTAARSETPEQTPFSSNYGIGASASAFNFGIIPIFCASLPPKAAEQLDRQQDDGNPQTGTIRAGIPSGTVNTPPAAATAGTTTYVDAPSTWYTVCTRL